MKLLLLPLAIVALVIGLAMAGPIRERWEDSNSYRRQIEAIQAQDYAQQTQATAASRAAASNLGYLAAGATAVLLLMFAVDFYRQRRAPIVRASGIPISRKAIIDADQDLINLLADTLRAAGIAQIEAARRPQVPASLNYSPRIETIDTTPEPAPALLATSPDVRMPRDRWMRWLDEQPHALLGGRTRAGKTTTATAILAERLRSRESVFVIDPHSSGWMGLPTAGSASNKGELARALGAVLGEYLQRMQARERHKQTTGQELPHGHFGRLTVVIDEANAIADELRVEWKTVLKQVASGSRKVGISLLVLAQSPLVEDLGISGAMRENFARLALDDRSVQLLIDSERDKARKDALRAALIGVERPAAAQIGSQVWLLDRGDMTPGSAPEGAQRQVWRGWDFASGRRSSNVSPKERGNSALPDQPVSGNERYHSGNEDVTASESESDDSLPVTISPEEIAKIAALLVGNTPSEATKKLDGYSPRKYRELRRKVDYVAALGSMPA